MPNSHYSPLSCIAPDIPVLQREQHLGFLPGPSVSWQYEQPPVPILDLLFTQHVRIELSCIHFIMSSYCRVQNVYAFQYCGLASALRTSYQRGLETVVILQKKSVLFNNHVQQWDPGVYLAGKCIFPPIEKCVKGSSNDDLLYEERNNIHWSSGMKTSHEPLIKFELTDWMSQKCLLQSTKKESLFDKAVSMCLCHHYRKCVCFWPEKPF